MVTSFHVLCCCSMVSHSISIFNFFRKIEIAYNGNRIVDVSVTTEKKTLVAEGTTLEMSYEVTWTESSVEFKDRYDKYLDASFFKHKVTS